MRTPLLGQPYLREQKRSVDLSRQGSPVRALKSAAKGNRASAHASSKSNQNEGLYQIIQEEHHFKDVVPQHLRTLLLGVIPIQKSWYASVPMY